MLRCRDVCVRCGGGPRRRTTIGLNGRSLSSGISPRATLARGVDNGLRVRDPVPRGTLAVGIQREAFTTRAARKITEQEIEGLRKQISRYERTEGRDSADKTGGEDKSERQQKTKPAMSSTALNQEMRWLKDPKELANRVKNLLIKEGAVEKSATLVREAQKEGSKCIVAWNHIMDYEMEQGRVESAFKFYNDMKKRGRRPDAHTYTIMFRGLASNAKTAKTVPYAVSLYDSLSSPSSTVKPSTIHGNAALNVCGRHGDMDALWEIAGKLPERGYGAPDATTYTIILHALRATTQTEVKKLKSGSQEDGIMEAKAAAVREAKRIWSDIVKQWHGGAFMIDQKLVSAMGQMLVYGEGEGDARDVFSLLRQTMGIEVVGPRREEERKFRREQFKAVEKGTAGEQQNEDLADIVKEPGTSNEALSEVAEEPSPSDGEEFVGLFEWVPLSKVRRNFELKAGVKSLPELQFPAPTNSELSLVLQACQLMHNGVGPARNYWKRLTSEAEKYKIVPDSNSYVEYLRVLRIGRASAESLQILEAMVRKFGLSAGKTFIIAMSACQRDRLNPNVLNTANAIIDLMGSTLPEPDPKTLERYVALMPLVTRKLPRKAGDEIRLDGFDSANKSVEETRHEVYSRALRKIRPHIESLKYAFENCDIGRYRKQKARRISTPEIDGEPRRFGAAIHQAQIYPISVDDSMCFLPKARALYNEILRIEYREFLSESDIEMYRNEGAALDRFLASTRKRGISGKTVFAIDKRQAMKSLKKSEAAKDLYREDGMRQQQRKLATPGKSTDGEGTDDAEAVA